MFPSTEVIGNVKKSADALKGGGGPVASVIRGEGSEGKCQLTFSKTDRNVVLRFYHHLVTSFSFVRQLLLQIYNCLSNPCY